MNSLETKEKHEETDVSCNDSLITTETERVDACQSLQLPLKKRSNKTKHAAMLSGLKQLTSDRVTRISSGTIKPRSFSDLCKVSIKTKSKGATGSLGREGASYSTPKQSKRLKSDAKCARKIKIQGLKNKRTASENSETLRNSDPISHDTVSGSTIVIVPRVSSVTTNVKFGRTRYVMQNADEMTRLTVPLQHKEGESKYNLLSSVIDCEKHHRVPSMPQISHDSTQSQDSIADEVVTNYYGRNQNSNVCDESGCGLKSAVFLAANKPKSSALDRFVIEPKSEHLDRPCTSSVKNTIVKVEHEDEAKKEGACTDASTCVESVTEHLMPAYVQQQCPNNAEGLQIYDAFNPDQDKQGDTGRSQKQKPRKQQNFRCTTCKLRFFETKDELEVHAECHVGKPGDPEFYQCKICPYSSSFWNRTLSHIIIHDEYKKRLVETKLAQNILGKFLCPECGRSFERKVNMQGHLKKVHFKENHTCDQCGLTLSGVDKKTFARHQEKCRNVKIACTFCNYTTTVTANMQKHMKIHNGEGFSCTVCSAVFPTRQRFQVRGQRGVNQKSLICVFNILDNCNCSLTTIS